jgi:hypothetical protein
MSEGFGNAAGYGGINSAGAVVPTEGDAAIQSAIPISGNDVECRGCAG